MSEELALATMVLYTLTLFLAMTGGAIYFWMGLDDGQKRSGR